MWGCCSAGEEGEEEARRSREGWEHTAAVSSPGLSLQAAREAPPGEMNQLQVPGEKPPSPASQQQKEEDRLIRNLLWGEVLCT